MEYILLSSTFENGLTEEVNEYLKNGWELYGNPFSTSSSQYRQFDEYGQAMIKKNANPESPTL